VIFGDPPDAATFHAHVALRQPLPAAGEAAVGNLVRLCPLVRPIWHEGHGPWRLPHGLCEADFKGLIELQLDGREQRDVDLIRKMTDLWLADAIPNQPIRMGDHMRCDIGHETFSEAAAHWRKIAPYRKATPSSGAAPAPQ
jgi:hypothetical protein